ncbi:MAG: 4-hydroxy-tetrahydrodipicolinate synthase [Bacteroidetes bacterium]|nr:MAG: 4-hydroxy-tetrahydrodipicolinate synthase [Bacteroidota bacterium]
MNQQVRGTGVAVVTPFKGAKVDFEALEKIINHVIDGGVDFIVSLGTTGEAITLSKEECREVFDFTIEKTAGRVPLVAGFFGSNNTARLVEGVKDYNLEGFSAIMSSSPAYNKPSQEGIFQHYMALEKASPLPIIIYNVPGRTASNVLPQTILRLARASEKFMAVKEASGDLMQAMEIIKHRPPHFQVFSGDDALTLPMLGCGADGAISVIANAFPAEFSGMVRHALAGDFPKARHYHELLLDIHPWLYVDGNPAGIKAVLAMMGMCEESVRLPLVPVCETTRNKLREAIRHLIQKPHLV